MSPKDIIMIGVEIILGLVLLVGGWGLIVQGFRKKPRDEKTDIINAAESQMQFWKKQAEDEKEISKTKEERWTTAREEDRKSYTIQINDLTREVGELRGQLSSEKAQNERLEKIFQRSDPETKKFMEHMVKSMENQDKMLTEIFKMAKAEQEKELTFAGTIVKDGHQV